jgi:phage minor structural protein, N-terminal domain protein|uniref:Neck appendage protein n=1 Tax=Siphoviridae sp. ctJgf18 TaxID=2825435 RepID=A0A8S5UVR9_9CAUD|nr:MAG TPA: Neck appendage protein [Siphoviridae sp. ctJgf18]
MIYLTEGNVPLNAAYADEIVQIDRNTYQLTFKFPTNNILWQRLREETFLIADDLHGEQDFVIFEVEKQHGYIQVYANQVMTLLNHYVVNPIDLDRETGSTALSRFAGSITRDNPFSFFSDIDDRHTFNTDTTNAMEALTKDKHSILGQWGGDLVRHGYQVRLLKNGGSENESLFMYKKNLSSYQHKTSTKSLKTRITFKTTVKGEGENADDKHYKVVVDSPLINKYSQIYEDVVEVNDQDVKDEASLREYGKQYFRTSLCDLMEDSLEINVVGQSDVPVQMFDVVGVYHETFDLDVRKKITKYTYSPMAKKLKSIGFGEFKSGLAHAIGNVVSDAVKNETYIFEARLEKEIKNADLDFDRKVQGIRNEITDGVEQAKALAEENKQILFNKIDNQLNEFDRNYQSTLEDQRVRIDSIFWKAQTAENLATNARNAADTSIEDAKRALKYARATNEIADANFVNIGKINDTIETLARKSELDPIKDRISITESKIEVQAGQITEKLSRTEVDKLVNDKGFQTATQVQNTVKKSVDGFQQTISRIETKLRDVIRNDNLLQNSSIITAGNGSDGTWRLNQSGGSGKTEVVSLTDAPHNAIKKAIRIVNNTNGWNKDIAQSVNLIVGEKYTMSCWARVINPNVNLLMRSWTTNDNNRSMNKPITNTDWVRYQFTFTADAVVNSIQFGQNGSGSLEICGMKLEHSDRMTDYDISSSEIVSIVEFNDVRDTVSSHTQTLQRQDQAISQVIQTADGLVSRVSNFLDDFNLVYDPTNFSKWEKTAAEANVIEVQSNTKLLRITSSGNTNNVYRGFRVPLNTSTFTKDEKISYRIFVWVDVVPDAPLVMDLWSADGGLASTPITLTQKGKQVITGTFTIKKTSNKGKEFPLEIILAKNGQVAIGQISLIRGDTPPKKFTDNTSTQDVVTQTRVAQLHDSYAIQTLTSPGAVTSQINLAPKDILIEAEKIRLKGKTLADEITAIDGYFKRLFVGDARIGTLNTDIIQSNSITADKVVMDSAMAKKIVSSDVFTDQLAAKNAFINKLRSVVVSATLLEGFKGRIGGFQIGTHDKDPSTYWLTGTNQFAVGMSNGSTKWGQTALWVNWGDNWNEPKEYAWFVKRTGEMYCYNRARFWNTPKVTGDLEVSGNIFFRINSYKKGYWLSSGNFKRIEESNGYAYLYRPDDSYMWIPLNKDVSDRRYKHNIEDSKVSALEVINRLKTYSYRKEYDGKIEDISCGIMAQDVQEYAPEAFLKNPDGAYSYNTFALVPYLIKAIQELNYKLEEVNEGRN